MTNKKKLELVFLSSALLLGQSFWENCAQAAAPNGAQAHKSAHPSGQTPHKTAGAKTNPASATAIKKPAGKPSGLAATSKPPAAKPGATATKAAPAAVPSKPVWTDVTNGFKYAKQVRKWILADVFTDWCGWCKRLDHDTFEDPTVEKWLASGFVCIKVNAEDGGAGEQLAKQYGVNGFPTIMIFEPSGKLKGTLEGYLKPTEFMQKVNQKITGQ